MPTLSANSQFVWKPEYSVGVAALDSQHKRLIASVNTLNEAMAVGRGRDVLGPLLDELIAYTKRHFAEEEQFMASFGFPDLAAHAVIHRRMTDKVVALRAKYQNGTIANTVEVFGFLKSWLVEHILRSDLAYARSYRERG
jgi:hemerythrin